MIVALLAAVAVNLTGQPTLILECGPLPVPVVDGIHALGNGTAEAADGLPHVWMLPRVCRSAYRREHFGLWVFAHEILHVRPNKSEGWTRRWDDWYAENVVRWKMRRIAEGRARI